MIFPNHIHKSSLNKYLQFIGLAFIFAALLTSCKTKKNLVSETASEPAIPSESRLSEEGPKLNLAFEIAVFEKTPCYGQCPVYKVRFMSDGTVTWFGRSNVDMIGTYESKVERQVLTEIQQKAWDLGYFKLADEYPINYKLADLPYTITLVHNGTIVKSVRNMLDAPRNLLDFEEYLEAIIEGLEWKSIQ